MFTGAGFNTNRGEATPPTTRGRMYAQRRDNNEPQIIATAQALGAYVQQMDKSAGFDLLVCDMDTHIVEVKNGNGKLTDSEAKVKAAVESAGGVYNIARSVFDVLEILGVSIQEIPTQQLWRLYNDLGKYQDDKDARELAGLCFKRLK